MITVLVAEYDGTSKTLVEGWLVKSVQPTEEGPISKKKKKAVQQKPAYGLLPLSPAKNLVKNPTGLLFKQASE